VFKPMLAGHCSFGNNQPSRVLFFSKTFDPLAINFNVRVIPLTINLLDFFWVIITRVGSQISN
jgi:hypothetical protein